MPGRNLTILINKSTGLRRSPRFLHHKSFAEPEGPITPNPQSRSSRSRYFDPRLGSKSNVSLKRTRKDCTGNVTVKLDESKSAVNSRTGLRKSPRLQCGIKDRSNLDASLKKIHNGYTEELGEDSREPSDKVQKGVKFSSGSRKSARLQGGVEGFSSPYLSLNKTHKNCVEDTGKKSSDELKICENSVNGSRKSSRLSDREGPKSVRKSPRFSCPGNTGEQVETMLLKDVLRKSAPLDHAFEVSRGFRRSPRFTSPFEVSRGFRRSPRFTSRRDNRSCIDKTVEGNSVLIGSSKENVLVVVRENEMGKRETRSSCRHVASPGITPAGRGSKKKEIDTGKNSKEIEINIKGKLGEEEDVGLLSGWTKEQELALERAYFAANPTPNFWKKVAKLVPGKFAQDCFDKIHSDHLTPPSHRTRSRANRSNSLFQDSVPLSASKILGPADPKIKRSKCRKQKTHLTQKAIRDLLQKHREVEQDYEVDMFSVLEPTATPYTQTLQQSVILSTPVQVQGKSIFLQKLRERSSSGHKKPRSRFSSSFGSALVSPPVLKPVKNRALHEKYIDHLHSREARRKMASLQAAKSTLGEEDGKEGHVQKMNAIAAAKNALVCDAKDAISQFQYLQANPLSNSSEFDDDDDVNTDEDDQGEDGI